MTDKEIIRAEIERRREEAFLGLYNHDKGVVFDEMDSLLSFIDSMQEEQLSHSKVTKISDQEEPKFKVGQLIKQGNTIAEILEISDDGYHCDNAFVPFAAQDSWELV